MQPQKALNYKQPPSQPTRMTSPFKDPPKITATCNHCEEDFTYNDTYSTGRLCRDCKDELDDPSLCEYSLTVEVDAVTRELHITVTVFHDLPTRVSISPYSVSKDESGKEMPTHRGAIADLAVSTETGEILYRDTWETERSNVLNPHSECSLTIKSIHSVSNGGVREWCSTVNGDSIFDQDTVTVNVAFPTIEDEVPESSLTETIELPSYLIDLN